MVYRVFTAAAFLLATSQTAAFAAEPDPCAGHDVSCDSDGCLVCWTGDDGDLVCEDETRDVIVLTLPGCVDQRGDLGLTTPDGGPGRDPGRDVGERVRVPLSPPVVRPVMVPTPPARTPGR